MHGAIRDMKPEKYCKNIVKKSGSNFYYSFFFLPKKRRRAVYAVYAFSRMIDDVADEESDVSAKEKMFSFWRSEIDAAYGGTSEHPLTKELGLAAHEFQIPRDYFTGHLNGVMQDVIQKRYATFEDLRNYCYRVASLVGLICLKIFGVDSNERNKEAAIDLGLAFQLTNIMRDVGSDAERGRIYIPEEDLSRFNLTEKDILEGHFSDDFIRMMSFEWERTDEIFKKARAGFDERARKKLLPAMVMAGIYYRILLKIKEHGFNVFDEKVRVPAGEKMMIALRAFLGRGGP